MELRRPRSRDPREVEKWEDEVSRQINYSKTVIGSPDAEVGELEIEMVMESKNPDPSINLNFPWINVQDDFGAEGHGVTDDSTAIQNAINSIPSGEKGVIYLPTGDYLCNTGIINNGRKVSFVGDGIENTYLIKGSNNIDLLKLDSSMLWQTIKDMTFDGNAKTGLSLLYLDQNNYVSLENLVIRDSASAVSALYLNQATGTILRNVYLWENTKSAFFNEIHGFRIYNLKIIGKSGAGGDDTDFLAAAQTSIFGLTISDYGGLTIRDCINFNIYGLYHETDLGVPAITIGTSGHPSYDVSINGGNATVLPGTHSGPLIKCQYLSQGIAIRDIEITQTQNTHYISGWIELGEVSGITIENITARSVSSTYTSATNLIFSSSVGPTDVTIKNVNAYADPDGTAIIILKADNLLIETSNVRIDILDGSDVFTLINCSNLIWIRATATNVVLINCSGTITDYSGAATRINSPG